MKKLFQKTLFIFRRDLRLEDNTGLIFALEASETVIPCFIFIPEQLENNPYRGDASVRFMIESLQDLDEQLRERGSRLYFFQGSPTKIIKKCIDELEVEALFANRDYTPYSIQRDKEIEILCNSHQIPFQTFDDALLHPPEETLKKDGKPYSIFTPYFHNASKGFVAPPTSNRATHYFQGTIPFEEKRSILSDLLPKGPNRNRFRGGRTEALKILKNLKIHADYGKTRDFPARDSSTHLSAYLKFTVCSPREVYAAICQQLGEHHDLIRSLYWRDFFTAIGFFFPHVFQGAFHPEFNRVKWSHDKEAFHRWSKGTTGFPIVDAGMRELHETGFMQNRVRMITASFLVKDLHIDWREGEKYFAQTLIDYDPAVNNGNWQWVASTGCDAQPYFRIFNPWNQQKKFDADCEYIKKWIPELEGLPSKVIHEWHLPIHRDLGLPYPSPMLDHSKEAKKALHFYRSI